MAVDILAASRRPLQRLLHDCSFSEWENIALFLDGGSTEAVRWAGGLGFVLEELGISQVLDLQVGGRVSRCCACKGSAYANIPRTPRTVGLLGTSVTIFRFGCDLLLDSMYATR